MNHSAPQDTGRAAAGIIEQLLTMERALRRLEGFDGWVIGSCRLTVAPLVRDRLTHHGDPPCQEHHSPQKEPEPTVLRRNKTMARIQVRADSSRSCHSLRNGRPPAAPAVPVHDQMELLLLHPAAPVSGTAPVAAPADEKKGMTGTAICFSAAEITRYLGQVSDYNSIHRGADAIVPGLLMMNRILAFSLRNRNTPTLLRADAKFPAPLPVCETAYLSAIPKKNGQETLLLQKGSGEIVLNMRVTYSDRPLQPLPAGYAEGGEKK